MRSVLAAVLATPLFALGAHAAVFPFVPAGAAAKTSASLSIVAVNNPVPGDRTYLDPTWSFSSDDLRYTTPNGFNTSTSACIAVHTDFGELGHFGSDSGTDTHSIPNGALDRTGYWRLRCSAFLPKQYGGNKNDLSYDLEIISPKAGTATVTAYLLRAGQLVDNNFAGAVMAQTPPLKVVFGKGGGAVTHGKLLLSYTMPQRFGLDKNHDGLIDYFTTPAQVAFGDRTVDVSVADAKGAACPSGSYSWHAGARLLRATAQGNCVFRLKFPKEGRYNLKATATGSGFSDSGSTSVLVQDWLIFGLGDSNGSGEGVPDVPGLSPVWQDKRCDRSANSFEPRAARGIENFDEKTSVTFVHLACSGASITQGMVGPYRGIQDPGDAAIASQLSQMERLAVKREIDAVLMSIGVNDIGFTPLVAFCIDQADCMYKHYPDASSPKTLPQVIEEKLAALPKLYAQLNARLERLHVPPRRVYITEYFDSTHAPDGSFCDPLIAPVNGGEFDVREARWVFEHVLVPLNGAVHVAAARYHWRLVGGIQREFLTHGYCSGDPWIVGLRESFTNEGSRYGTLHANNAGQQYAAGAVATLLAVDLYLGGKPRAPK